MTGWADLERELDAWGRRDQTATFWWRDDDAVTATPALQRLFAVAATGRPVPLALAVIPALADATLVEVLRRADHAVALQHGFSHTNHAPQDSKKAEFGANREPLAAMRELQRGAERMRALFAERALPVLVPPWNRIDPALVSQLGNLGFRGLSTYRARAPRAPGEDVTVVNTHVDIVNWRDGHRFLGVPECLELAISHLAARRDGRADPSEPTGLLTHHLIHELEAWTFLASFVQCTSRHPATRWLGARQLFGLQPQRGCVESH